jgi:hypothetical protein
MSLGSSSELKLVSILENQNECYDTFLLGARRSEDQSGVHWGCQKRREVHIHRSHLSYFVQGYVGNVWMRADQRIEGSQAWGLEPGWRRKVSCYDQSKQCLQGTGATCVLSRNVTTQHSFPRIVVLKGKTGSCQGTATLYSPSLDQALAVGATIEVAPSLPALPYGPFLWNFISG